MGKSDNYPKARKTTTSVVTAWLSPRNLEGERVGAQLCLVAKCGCWYWSSVERRYQCQSSHSPPAFVPMHPLEWLEHPWECFHFNYTEPFMSKVLLLVIDAHSKWKEVEAVNTASTQNTIEHLHSVFSRFGLPQVMVTDNDTCFISYEFKDFATLNHI